MAKVMKKIKIPGRTLYFIVQIKSTLLYCSDKPKLPARAYAANKAAVKLKGRRKFEKSIKFPCSSKLNFSYKNWIVKNKPIIKSKIRLQSSDHFEKVSNWVNNELILYSLLLIWFNPR